MDHSSRLPLLSLVGALCLFAPAAPAASDEPPFTQQTARDIIAESRRVVSGHGVETQLAIPIQGTQQWISVRGHDTRNPILLFIHGGPASPDMPLAYTFQTPWEDYFTVVQWDQRGAGKTYAANDPKRVAATMTVEQMTADAVDVVRYLRKTYHKDKIFVLGHSWGSVLGVKLAAAHPEWLYAYVGVGQMVNMRKSEADGYRYALERARAENNRQAIADLTAIAPYPPASGPLDLVIIGKQRKWLEHYGGLAWGRGGFEFDAEAEMLAPEYSDRELDAIGAGSGFTFQHLIAAVTAVDLSALTTFAVPIFLFEGRHDYSVSHERAAAWFATVKAPTKELVWFEDSAHMTMQEQPGRFLVHLVEDVRPYAVKAGDAAPDELVTH
jgi:pimeloyl-ACP methyl ester carboxylesterase